MNVNSQGPQSDSEQLIVHDDFLDEAAAREIFAWLDSLVYKSVHSEGWKPVWRLTDASVLRGPTWSVGFDGSPGPEGELPLPLQALGHRIAQLVLEAGTQWMVSMTPWIYPVGSGLGLHRDDRRYRGAFSYYLTPEWDIHWGGLLLALANGPAAAMPKRAVFDPGRERRFVGKVGRGSWVLPAWNRLVVIPPDVHHSVTRVDTAAGDRSRISIAGFVHERS
jgi:hypothetical protein